MVSWKMLEKNLRLAGARNICGIDEAGRGPLAGPVVAAAVVLPEKIKLPGLRDSKKLLPAKREKLFKLITAKSIYGVGVISNKKIDRIGIVRSIEKAMRRAIDALADKLKTKLDCLLVDGIDNFQFGIPTAFIEKGDNRVRSIQAASIIAKVTRDKIMINYGRKYPAYAFRLHKGYGTRKHYTTLRKNGPCEIHRLTFRLK